MLNCDKKYFETYYEDSGTPVDYASALASAAALHFLGKLEELAREDGAIDKELEQIQYGYGCDLDSEAKERQSELYERQEEISDERDEIYSILQHPAELSKRFGAEKFTIDLAQIFRVDVDKLLNDVYDKSANTLNFGRLFEILSAKISSETARHINLLEALLDISVFEEHKDFFEALYIENLITSKDLLKLFIDSTESCQNLFVCHHKELVPALLKEYSNCCFAKEDTEIKWSLEEFCDKLEYYATHDIEKNSLKSLVLRLNLKKIHDEGMQELLAYIKKFKRLSIFENLFDKQQLSELISIFVDNEVAQNKLIQIVDNNLEQHYDFDSLTDYLKKNEKKNVMNI